MCWAAGSLLAGVVTGTITWRASPARRFRIGSLALALSLVPLPFVDQPIVIAGLLAISGMAIAPTLIASVAVTQGAVLPNRLTEALGWTSTGLASGVAAGAAVVGQLIDYSGSTAGFWGVVGFGLLLIMTAVFVRSSRPTRPTRPSAQRREILRQLSPRVGRLKARCADLVQAQHAVLRSRGEGLALAVRGGGHVGHVRPGRRRGRRTPRGRWPPRSSDRRRC